MSSTREARRHQAVPARQVGNFVQTLKNVGRSDKPERRRALKLKTKPLSDPSERSHRGPLSGTRVVIVGPHPRHGLTATLTHRYMKYGAYYARLDAEVYGQEWETVVRPGDWETL